MSLTSSQTQEDMQAEAQLTQGMLTQLPQPVQKQIEQAVNEYRQQLTDQGCTADLQMLVWNYYTKCVKQLYEKHGSTASAQDAGAEQHDQTTGTPQLGQWSQMQQVQQMQQQRQLQMQQGLLRPRLGAQTLLRPSIGSVPGIIRPTRSPMLAGFGGVGLTASSGGDEAMGSGAASSGAGADAEQQDSSMQASSFGSSINAVTGTSVKAKGAIPQAWNQPQTQGALGPNGMVRFPLKGCGKGAMGSQAGFQMQQGQKGGMGMTGPSMMMGAMSGCKGQGGMAGCKGGMVGCKGGMAGKPGGLAGKGPAKAAGHPQFPPALQRWLQRLFHIQNAQTGETDQDLQKETHKYLKHWVQVWVKSGELWHKNWEVAALPTPDEIRANLPPGALSGQASGGAVQPGCLKGKGGFMGKGYSMTPPTSKAKGGSPPRGFSGGDGDQRQSGRGRRSRSRSRSRSGRRRSRSRGRRKRRSSSSRSCKRRGSRSRDSSQSPGPAQGWGKGKGKDGKDGKDGKGKEKPSNERERVRQFVDQRLSMQDYRGNTQELAGELQRVCNVSGKRFRTMFSQTLNQYAQAFYSQAGSIGTRLAAQLKAGPLSQDEQDMRAARADRFKTHLEAEKAPVAMVSFNDGENAMVNGGPITGELDEMCSRHEAKEREMTRQLDKFEWKQGTDPRHPEVNLALATRKYQRSSADKAYKSSETRTLAACWRTMQFLMTQILDFDIKPKPQFAVQKVPYIQCYSYLRDRTRAIRVELHLQQPRSTTQRTFLESHECCLRFEMLTLYLLMQESAGGSGNTTEKYDPKLGLKAISQTIEPLLNAYQAVKAKVLAKSILAEAMGGFDLDEGDGEEQEYCSSYEMVMHRYIILLLMSFSPEGIGAHLAKLDKEVISHPLISFATQAYAAFQTEDFGRFLHFYREADFLTAVAMSGIADLARIRALFLLFRTYPQPVGDKVPLSRLRTILACSTDAHLRHFLTHHGAAIEESASGPYMVLPKKGTPAALSHPLLSGPNRLPEKCDFPKGRDSLLDAKYRALGISRADIVFGSADPVVEVPAAEPEPPAELEATSVAAEPPQGEPVAADSADVVMQPAAGPGASGAQEAAAGVASEPSAAGEAPAEAEPVKAG